MIAQLRSDLQGVRDTLSDTQSVTSAVVAATTAVAGLDNDSPAADVTAARAAVEAAKTALAGAPNVSDGDRASLQAAIDSLGTSLSTVEMAVADRPTEAEIAAAGQKTMDAATKVTAINAEAAEIGTDDAGLGGNDGLGVDGNTGTVDDIVTMTIERPRAGTEITIADSTMTEEDDPKFEQMMDLGESNRFARTMHLRVNSDTSDEEDGSKVEEVVIVATDIAAPTATPFNDVHALDSQHQHGERDRHRRPDE